MLAAILMLVVITSGFAFVLAAGTVSADDGANAPGAILPPRAPTIVRVTTTASTATVFWVPPTDNGGSPITAYRIYWGLTSGSTSNVATQSASLPNSFTATGLAPRTTYYFTLQALNVVGSGHVSVSVGGRTLDIVPNAVNDLAVDEFITGIDVSWSAPTPNGGSPITNYRFYFGETPSPTTYFDFGICYGVQCRGLDPETTYYFIVVAQNAQGFGTPASIDGTTLVDIVPAEPYIDSLTPALDQVTVSWDQPVWNGGTPITGYRVFWGTAVDPHDIVRSVYVGSGMSVDITGLLPATKYYFAVAAINAVGQGVPSASESTTTLNIVPGVPSSIGFIRGSNLDIDITWTAPIPNGGTAVTGYKIFYGTSPEPSVDFVIAGPSDVTTHIDGLTNELYYFNVVAVNAEGEGQPTGDVSATPNCAPAAPSNLHSNSVGVNSVTLHWTAPVPNGGSPVTGYTIYWGTSTGPTDHIHTGSASVTYTVTGLAADTTYFFNVAAENMEGTGPQDGEISRTTDNVEPNEPNSVDPTSGATTVTVTWTEPSWGSDIGSPVNNYEVRYRRATGWAGSTVTGWSSWSYSGNLGNVLTFTTPTLAYTTTNYWFEVRAQNAEGWGDWSMDWPAWYKGYRANAVPSAPTWGTATPHLNSVDLSWSAGPAYYGTGITRYDIYFGTEDNPTTYYGHTHGSTSITVSGLLANTLYYFRVTASNDKGEGAYSLSISTTTTNVVPARTTITSLTPNYDPFYSWMIDLVWVAPTPNGGSPVTGYDIMYDDHTPPTYWESVGLRTEVSLIYAQPMTTYYFQIRAYNAAGAGPWSTLIYDATTGDVVPGQPSITSITPGLNNVELVWMAPADNDGSPVTNYRVYWGTAPNPNNIINSVLLGDVLTYTVTGLNPATTYYFNVVAINAEGAGAASMDAFTTTTDVVPNAPSNLAADPERTTADVSWDVPIANGGTPVLYYRVYWYPSGGSTSNDVALTNSFTLEGLTPDTLYYFFVVAVNSKGDSFASDSEDFQTDPDIVPGAPLILMALPYETEVYVDWNAPAPNGGSPILTYRVYYGVNPSPAVDYQYVNAPNTCHTLIGLTCGTLYYINVVAVNAEGSSPASSDLPARPNRVPNAPNIQAVSIGTNNDATVFWLPPIPNGGTPVTSYNVFYGQSPYPYVDYVTVPGNFGGATISGLTPGVRYYFNVVAVNLLGSSLPSQDRTDIPNSVPLAPVIGTATPGIGQATVTWSAADTNGGSAILSYRVYYGTEALPDSNYVVVGGAQTSVVITGLTPGSTYYFNVVAYNNVYNSDKSSDASCTVPIGSRSITVLSPNGGEVWRIGSYHLILWTSNDIPSGAMVRIDLYKAGRYYLTVSTATENDGVYNWRVAGRVGSDYTIVISLVNTPSVRDSSNSNFTLNLTGFADVASMEAQAMVNFNEKIVAYAQQEAW
jgi:titin